MPGAIIILCVFVLIWYKLLKLKHEAITENDEDTNSELILNKAFYHDILLSKSHYYCSLSEEGRKTFLKRLGVFIDKTSFKSMEGLNLTEEMVVLISSAAIQLTFGYEYYLLSEYDSIYVYPDAIFYAPTGEFHSGQTATGKFIKISWKNFQENLNDRFEGKNVGLHEMAHALEFSFVFGNKYDNTFADYYDAIQEKEFEEFNKMRAGNSTFLNEYASTNIHEFFAVCVEYFFGDPDNFRYKLPDLYTSLCLLLNQDPLNRHDYQLEKEKDIYKNVEKNPNNRKWQWWLTFILLGIFLSPVVLYIATRDIIISNSQIAILVVLTALLSSVIHYRYFRKNGWMGWLFYSLYNLAGTGMTVVAFLLVLNRFVFIAPAETSFYRIDKVVTGYQPDEDCIIEVYFPELNDDREIYIPFTGENLNGKFLEVKTRKGIFFFKVIIDKSVHEN